MSVKGLIYVCPECKSVAMTPLDDASFIEAPLILCVEDGYRMKMILLDDDLCDRLLKDEVGKEAR